MGRITKHQQASIKAALAKRDKCIAANTHGTKTEQIGFGVYCAVCGYKVDVISEQAGHKLIMDALKNQH